MTAKGKKPPVVEAVEADDLDLYEQLRELGGGATIQVYREPNREFLDVVQPDAVEVDQLKDMFGGGSYSLRARRDGTWIKGISMVRVRIAGAPKPGSPGQPIPGETTPTPSPAAPAPRPAATTVEGRLAELEATLYNNREARPSGEASALQMMTTLLVPVLTTALQRQPENSAVEILELARKLAKDQREAANANLPESDVVRDLGIPLLNVIQRGLPSATPPAGLLPGPPAEPEETPTALTAPELAGRIAAWCEPLERRDADPTLRAWCFLEDMKDSPLLEGTLALIRLPDVMELWAHVAPRVAENREWYASFIGELRRLTDDPDTDDPEGDAGDVQDPQGNGESVAARQPDAGNLGAGV